MSDKSPQFDVIIIGAGLAGLAAARQAVRRGLKVLVVAPDFGATAHFSGAFDLVDPRWSAPAEVLPRQLSLTAALNDFIRAHPRHLYAELARGRAEFAPQLLADMQDMLKTFGVPTVGDGERTVIAFGSAGTAKPCAFAMAAQGIFADEVRLLSRAAYLDIPYLSDFPTPEILKSLGRVFAEVRLVRLADWPVNRLSPLAGIAQSLADEGSLAAFAALIAPQLGNAQILLVPPCLGRDPSAAARLQKILGVRVLELLSAMPSLAGERLTALVRANAAHAGVELRRGKVIAARTGGRRVLSLSVQDGAGGAVEELTAAQYILAAGKFIGGGLRHDGHFSEPLFRLPLWKGDEPLTPHAHVTQLISAQGMNRQAFLTVGVKTDAAGHPVYQDVPVFANLKACGHILAGFDFARDRCGFGVSVASAARCFA